MKKILLSLLLCSPILLTNPSPKTFEIATQETHKDGERIEARIQAMLTTCNQTKYPSACIEEYSNQFRNYLQIRNTYLCCGHPYIKPFTFQSSKKGKVDALRETTASLELRRNNPQVNACVNTTMALYQQYYQQYLTNHWQRVPVTSKNVGAPTGNSSSYKAH